MKVSRGWHSSVARRCPPECLTGLASLLTVVTSRLQDGCPLGLHALTAASKSGRKHRPSLFFQNFPRNSIRISFVSCWTEPCYWPI